MSVTVKSEVTGALQEGLPQVSTCCGELQPGVPEQLHQADFRFDTENLPRRIDTKGCCVPHYRMEGVLNCDSHSEAFRPSHSSS